MTRSMTGAVDNERLIGGRYALEKLIGEGATGEVWRARHTALQSLVAIKFLHGSAAFRESTRKRFLKEAQVAAHLNTRHAVQVFDFGVTEQGRPYLIMELLDGETLARRLVRVRRLSPAQTGHILKLASRALDRAHSLGIVHRDFKPENIFLIEDEEGAVDVKVVDFGVAKLVGDLEEDRDEDAAPPSQPTLSSLSNFTRTGATVGTPSYMSPEQARARPDIGPPADIWAMGVVAYECLTGTRPFRAPTLQALFDRIAKRSYTPAHDLFPDVPHDFDRWFRTACDPKPNKRFSDTAAAAVALFDALGLPPNIPAIPDADITGSGSRRFRSSSSNNPPVDLQESSGPSDLLIGRISSKPAPFVRSSRPIDRPAPASRVALAAMLVGVVVVTAVVAWRWSNPAPAPQITPASTPIASAPSPNPSQQPAMSASAPANTAASASPPDSAPAEIASMSQPRRDTKPPRVAPQSTKREDEPAPEAASTPPPPPPAPPTPKTSATATAPSSPFQLPDLGL